MNRVAIVVIGMGTILGTISAANLSIVPLRSPAEIVGLTLDTAVNNPRTRETLAVAGEVVTAELAERMASAGVEYVWTVDRGWSHWSLRWGFVAAVGLLVVGLVLARRDLRPATGRADEELVDSVIRRDPTY